MVLMHLQLLFTRTIPRVHAQFTSLNYSKVILLSIMFQRGGGIRTDVFKGYKCLAKKRTLNRECLFIIEYVAGTSDMLGLGACAIILAVHKCK